MNTDISEELYKKARTIIAGGVNADIKYREPYPIFAKYAHGSHIWDADENEYIDYVLSYGAIIFGHGHQVVVKAIRNVLDTIGTTAFGTPNELELELSEMILSLYHKDGRVRLTNSGLEATLLAIRLAMGVKNKSKIAKFDGHYHGANPFLLSNYRPKGNLKNDSPLPKEPDSIEIFGKIMDDMVILPFNDIEGTKKILDENRGQIAALIMEPFEDGYIAADADFMHFLREYTEENEIILIFDEVKTGFRVRPGGGSEYYNIKPDISCIGKVLGGGLPIGAVCGRSDLMSYLDPSIQNGRKVFHSGTFNGNPLSVGVGIATVREVTRKENFEKLLGVADDLREGISKIFIQKGIEHKMYGAGGIVNYSVGELEVKTYRDLVKTRYEMRKRIDSMLMQRNLFVIPGSRLSVSLSHSREDIETTLQKFSDVVELVDKQ